MSMKLGLYIHIPFCQSKCLYCDFYSERRSEDFMDLYTEKMCKSIAFWGKKAEERIVDTIYFGGGTPSIIGTERILKILDAVSDSFIFDNPEVTIEMNPSSLIKVDLLKLRERGFNRLSIGLQSAVDSELALLGRKHRSGDALKTVELAKQCGFSNISLDIMLGIPYQTMTSLDYTLEFIIKCGIQHISCYMLKLEQGTPLYKNRSRYRLRSEDEYCDFYEYTEKKLKDCGFTHYEISNFCLDGFESRHNTKYWQLGEYIGIGPSAHSFFEGKRFFYPRSFEDFFEGRICPDGIGGDPEEFVMLALRLKDGLRFDDFKKKYGFSVPNAVLKKALFFENQGIMNVSEESFSLTEKGFLLSNEIIVQLLEEF